MFRHKNERFPSRRKCEGRRNVSPFLFGAHSFCLNEAKIIVGGGGDYYGYYSTYWTREYDEVTTMVTYSPKNSDFVKRATNPFRINSKTKWKIQINFHAMATKSTEYRRSLKQIYVAIDICILQSHWVENGNIEF